MGLMGLFRRRTLPHEAEQAAARSLSQAGKRPQSRAPSRAGARFFDGSRIDRLAADWTTTPAKADVIIRQHQRVLVARAREQARNNDYARAFVRLARTHVAGPRGVLLQAQSRGDDGRLDTHANAAIEDAFALWARRESCDVAGMKSWRALQAAAVASAVVDGEFMFRMVFGADAGPFGIALQMLDPQRCNPQHDEDDLPGGRFIRAGIEFNQYGRPLAFHFADDQSEDAYGYSHSRRDSLRVPAAEIIHGFLPEFTGQKRGLPWMATGLFRMRQLAGFEDAAVPPEQLGDYLRDFTALMEEFDIDGLLYGHFGDGCVHVRLSMPLETPEGVAHSRAFLQSAARICAAHGGSISGEHGDGRARGELLRFMYSPEMLDLFARVKHVFDPGNLLNPGVLAAPMDEAEASSRSKARTAGVAGDPAELQPGVDSLDRNLRRVAARPMPADGGFAFTHDGGDFTAAVHRCTGVGKCRAGVSGTFMCPSYLATREEKDVTRGRARILQEAANSQLVKAIDSPEVLEALDLCLACKACSADCPAGVDMARYRSEALFRTYRGRLRPLSHYTLGWLPRLTRVSARVPGLATLANTVMSITPLRSLAFRLIGLDPRRGMPALQSGTFTAWARRHSLLVGSVPSSVLPDPVSGASDPVSESRERGGTPASPVADSPILSGPCDPSGRPYALVWADSFSQTLDDAGARAVVDVLEANGFAPIVAPDACCGLTWITTGQLTGAKKHLSSLLGVLAPFAASGIPIVGVEPSCTAVLRDDLLDLLPEDPRSALVSGATRTLAEVLSTVPSSSRNLPSLEGVEIVAQPHCHHYSVMGWDTDQALLESLGARVTRLEGCCGLAGNFGMEAGHYDLSVAVASHSLLPSLSAQPDAVYLADGFSCRTQAAQLAGRGGVHLATLLAGK